MAKYGFLSSENNIFSNFSSVVDCQVFSKLLILNDKITIVRKNGEIGYEQNLPKLKNITFEYSSLNFKNVSEIDMFSITILSITFFFIVILSIFLVKLFIRTNKMRLLRIIKNLIMVETIRNHTDIENVTFKVESELNKLKVELSEKIGRFNGPILMGTHMGAQPAAQSQLYLQPQSAYSRTAATAPPEEPIDFIFENLHEKMKSIEKISPFKTIRAARISKPINSVSTASDQISKRRTTLKKVNIVQHSNKCNFPKCPRSFPTPHGLLVHSRIHKDK